MASNREQMIREYQATHGCRRAEAVRALRDQRDREAPFRRDITPDVITIAVPAEPEHSTVTVEEVRAAIERAETEMKRRAAVLAANGCRTWTQLPPTVADTTPPLIVEITDYDHDTDTRSFDGKVEGLIRALREKGHGIRVILSVVASSIIPAITPNRVQRVVHDYLTSATTDIPRSVYAWLNSADPDAEVALHLIERAAAGDQATRTWLADHGGLLHMLDADLRRAQPVLSQTTRNVLYGSAGVRLPADLRESADSFPFLRRHGVLLGRIIDTSYAKGMAAFTGGSVGYGSDDEIRMSDEDLLIVGGHTSGKTNTALLVATQAASVGTEVTFITTEPGTAHRLEGHQNITAHLTPAVGLHDPTLADTLTGLVDEVNRRCSILDQYPGCTSVEQLPETVRNDHHLHPMLVVVDDYALLPMLEPMVGSRGPLPMIHRKGHAVGMRLVVVAGLDHRHGRIFDESYRSISGGHDRWGRLIVGNPLDREVVEKLVGGVNLPLVPWSGPGVGLYADAYGRVEVLTIPRVSLLD